jgi:oligogalacturonide lyase
MHTSFLMCLVVCAVSAADEIPDEWVDADTGHRVIRLSRREGNNASFYFHQNPFPPDGTRMLFSGSTPEGTRLFSVNLDSLAIEQVTERPATFAVVSPKSPTVFYLSDGTVCATSIDTGQTREIATVPEVYRSGRGFSVNADETLLLGCYAEGEAEFYKRPRSEWFEGIWAAHLPNTLYTIHLETGAIKEFHHENEWLGHVQFSPKDPNLLMYCHEGPWERVDRIWLIHIDGTGRRKVHERTMESEIAGHEFWGPKGKRIWFDLQRPRSTNFYIASHELQTAKETWYPIAREEWSLHYNISPDGTMLCGDGGDRNHVAKTDEGKWTYLYRLEGERVDVERLCSMADHDYRLEPNVRFTPDGKWVAFRSNMHGIGQVYAVEVAKTNQDTGETP